MLSKEKLAQIERFKIGFPWMKIIAAATPSKGVVVMSQKEIDEAIEYYSKTDVKKTKFVPASGAASRMFKDLFAGYSKLLQGKELEENSPAKRFVDNIKAFPFYSSELFEGKSAQEILANTLTASGLEYGAKPKGVLKFHSYNDEIRTAIAEHLFEAQEYMREESGEANIVVTISEEHQSLFEDAISEVKDRYESQYGIKYNIEFVYQDKSTDTIAVTIDNEPFVLSTGEFLLRPAGHGALIHNLNKLDSELVSIKNIDNVCCERLEEQTAYWKKVLMGKALMLRDTIFAFLNELDKYKSLDCKDVKPSDNKEKLLSEIVKFLENTLCISIPDEIKSNSENLVKFVYSKLNRPIRVCGVVKNQGEPGGGPFIIAEKDGSTSLQILESVQINPDDESAKSALANVTHFNPVDLVCCLKDYKGQKFNLLDYVDQEAGFISQKSFEGRELKALELPGLWNGSMSNWNTVFVEVPLITFNPVKTVLDLLRAEHRND